MDIEHKISELRLIILFLKPFLQGRLYTTPTYGMLNGWLTPASSPNKLPLSYQKMSPCLCLRRNTYIVIVFCRKDDIDGFEKKRYKAKI